MDIKFIRRNKKDKRRKRIIFEKYPKTEQRCCGKGQEISKINFASLERKESQRRKAKKRIIKRKGQRETDVKERIMRGN